MTGVRDLQPGDTFPDLELPDHDAHTRALSELAGGDPLVLHTYRGWWCPKERAWFRHLLALQEDAEVAYTPFASLSADPPATSAAFRAGLDARWPFLSDPGGAALERLGLRETTDAVHDPYLPTVWLLGPGGRLDDDPFRLLGTPLLLPVEAGLLGTTTALTGPAQERYAGSPWPAGSFGPDGTPAA